jgi:hypothetical protein
MLISGFLDFIIPDRMTGGFNESGINGNAFIDSEVLGFKLAKNLGVELIHGILGQSAFYPVRNTVLKFSLTSYFNSTHHLFNFVGPRLLFLTGRGVRRWNDPARVYQGVVAKTF